MSLKDSITEDMKSAMKAGAKDRLKVLRLILAAIKQVEVDTRSSDTRRRRRHSASSRRWSSSARIRSTSSTKGGREDLASIETAEIEVLETYLPEQMDDAELDALIDEVDRGDRVPSPSATWARSWEAIKSEGGRPGRHGRRRHARVKARLGA